MVLIFGKVLSIFLIAGVGFFANKRGILPNASETYLVNLLLIITSPCMIFTSIVSRELGQDTLGITLTVFLGAAAYFLLFSLLAYFLFGRVLHFTPREDLPVYTLIFVSINCGFMGFPLTQALFGDDILYLMVIINIAHTVYLFPFASVQLRMFGGDGEAPAQSHIRWKEVAGAAVNPCTLAAAIGMLWLILALPVPDFLYASIEMIGDATVPLSMLLVGLKLGSSNFGRILRNKRLLLVAALRMALVPVLVFLLVNWLPISDNCKVTLIFASCFASGVAIVPIASKEKKNALLASEGVALTTLLSLVTIPLSSMLLMGYYGLV